MAWSLHGNSPTSAHPMCNVYHLVCIVHGGLDRIDRQHMAQRTEVLNRREGPSRDCLWRSPGRSLILGRCSLFGQQGAGRDLITAAGLTGMYIPVPILCVLVGSFTVPVLRVVLYFYFVCMHLLYFHDTIHGVSMKSARPGFAGGAIITALLLGQFWDTHTHNVVWQALNPAAAETVC